MLKLGLARREITPRQPVALAGFADRKGNFNEIAQPLYVRAAAFAQPEQRSKVVILVADIIWWGPDTVQAMMSQWPDREWQLILHATHSHSGPVPSKNFSRLLGEFCQDWHDYLIQQSIAAAREAISDLQDISTIESTQGVLNFAIQRRRADRNGNIIMAPNFAGPHSTELNILRFLGTGGSTRAIFFHYPCHPTTMGDNIISAEFPGLACQLLEQDQQAAMVFALQGFCGDQRPALIQGDRFYRGTTSDVEYLANLIRTEVSVLLQQQLVSHSSDKLQFFSSRQQLPQQQQQSASDLNEIISHNAVDSIKYDWAQQLFAGRQCPPELVIQGLQLGEDICLLSVNAEVVLPYSELLKPFFKSYRRFLPLGYTQGMIGYLPTAKYLQEGGYEADGSNYYFLLAAPFAAAVESCVIRQSKEIAERFLRVQVGY